MKIHDLANKQYKIAILKNSVNYKKTQEENSITLEKQYTNEMKI